MNTVESLKQLYVKMGGNLSDSYPEIASGIPVSDYVLIPDCISALNKVAGSSGGVKVLTLYAGMKGSTPWCYKNSEKTEEYASFEEARDAVSNADLIQLDSGNNLMQLAVGKAWHSAGSKGGTKGGGESSYVTVDVAIETGTVTAYLYNA